MAAKITIAGPLHRVFRIALNLTHAKAEVAKPRCTRVAPPTSPRWCVLSAYNTSAARTALRIPGTTPGYGRNNNSLRLRLCGTAYPALGGFKDRHQPLQHQGELGRLLPRVLQVRLSRRGPSPSFATFMWLLYPTSSLLLSIHAPAPPAQIDLGIRVPRLYPTQLQQKLG